MKTLIILIVSMAMITNVRAGNKPTLNPTPEYLIGTDTSNSDVTSVI